MNTLFYASLLLTGAIAVNYNDSASEVYAAASKLNDEVSKFTAAKGPAGALSIQGDFPQLSSALSDFSGALSSGTPSDIDVQATQHFATELTSLLDSLTQKAQTFNQIHLGSVAANDLQGLGNVSKSSVNNLMELLGKDESKWTHLKGAITNLKDSINKANEAYGISPIDFDPAPNFTDLTTAEMEMEATSASSWPSRVSSTLARASSVWPTSSTSAKNLTHSSHHPLTHRNISSTSSLFSSATDAKKTASSTGVTIPMTNSATIATSAKATVAIGALLGLALLL